jgi:hypothetical protein
MSRDRRKSIRYPTVSIPVQLAELNGELIDLSLHGAAVVHRSPIKTGVPITMIFPSYGGIYVPCEVLRSIVQVRRGSAGPEYMFRSAITFLPMESTEEGPLIEFLNLQILKLEEMREKARLSGEEPEIDEDE